MTPARAKGVWWRIFSVVLCRLSTTHRADLYVVYKKTQTNNKLTKTKDKRQFLMMGRDRPLANGVSRSAARRKTRVLQWRGFLWAFGARNGRKIMGALPP
jgi:hypothetical protein